MDVDIQNAIGEVLQAIAHAQDKIEDINLKVETVEFEFTAVVANKVEGGLELEVLDVGGEATKGKSTKVALTLAPVTATKEFAYSDELADALFLLLQGTQSLDQDYAAKSAAIEIEFTLDAEGHAKFFFGGGRSKKLSHLACLNLVPV